MAGNYFIRKAERKDAGGLFKISESFAVHHKEPADIVTTTPKDFADNLSSWYECLVLVYKRKDEEDIVGYAIFYYFFNIWKGRMAYLEALYVSPEHQGRGHGLSLIQCVAKIAHHKGCYGMRWIVLGWNTVAKQLYSKIKADNLTEQKQEESMDLKESTSLLFLKAIVVHQLRKALYSDGPRMTEQDILKWYQYMQLWQRFKRAGGLNIREVAVTSKNLRRGSFIW